MSAKRSWPRMLEIENVTFVDFSTTRDIQPECHETALPAIRDEIRQNRCLILALIDLLSTLAADPQSAVFQDQKSGNEELSPAPHKA